MSRFIVTDTPLAGLKVVQRQILGDPRGYLSRLFCADELQPVGWQGSIAQINHTFTQHVGTVRGMHYQKAPYSEIKLVSCLHGDVWDVAVDLRPDSPTYLRWHAQHLSADNHCALLIPQGFAHGFQTLSDDVEMLYCHSAPYAPEADAGLNPLDARLTIAWPLPVSVLSAKDSTHAMIGPDFEGVRV
jgi:dTDP-4-dehydrorhamnose 3,5-epimerase